MTGGVQVNGFPVVGLAEVKFVEGNGQRNQVAGGGQLKDGRRITRAGLAQHPDRGGVRRGRDSAVSVRGSLQRGRWHDRAAILWRDIDRLVGPLENAQSTLLVD